VFDDGSVDDARLVDPRPPGMRRVEARHVLVWIRHQGAWRRGSIHCWFVHRGAWMAWMQHRPVDPEDPQAVWGLYAYDGVTIRRRHHPAAQATVEVPAAWGPSRVVQTRIRDLGYAVDLVKTGDEADELLLG
jgi:hypothetical protein